ncbi:MAG: site-specific integrase [Anaerolineaceae bacterium]|nr:site-specific integrase [Anaerolineaceae bacterium]
MNLSESSNFTITRDFAIIEVLRSSDSSIVAILATHQESVLEDGISVLIGSILLNPASSIVLDYLHVKNKLLPDCDLFFPTKEGKQFSARQFSRNILRLLKQAGCSISSGKLPRKIGDKDHKELQNLYFRKKRPYYQSIIAFVLCSFFGLRAGEVAKLTVDDLDFANNTILLLGTKSQKDQELYMIQRIVEPLKHYVSHLPKGAPLFINAAGNQWNYKDTTKAVKDWSRIHGITGITPKVLRASLGAELARECTSSPAKIAKILRHADPATAIRHYNTLEVEEANELLETVSRRRTENR